MAPPTISLSDCVLHHTWSIRLLSLFAVPLEIDGVFTKLEEDLALFLQIRRRETARQQESNGAVEEIMSVHLFWGSTETELNGREDSRNSEYKSSEGTNGSIDPLSKKRKRIDDTETPKHLIIDIRVQDESSAQVVCFYPLHEVSGSGKLNGFEFLLTRGSKSSVEGVICWLETVTKCKTAASVFRPSVADVARATTLWTSEHWQLTAMKKEGKGNNQASSDTKATKPLTLTYQVPTGQAAGLETISLTVPPVALLSLCGHITSRKGAGQSMSDPIRGANENGAIGSSEQESIPIVKALQCFLRETFRIQIEKFSLIRASCSAAVLGCDGRFKPVCAALLGDIFEEIRYMIKHKVAASPQV